MRLRKVKILLILSISFVFGFLNQTNAQPIGRWSVGVTGSVEYFIRTLTNPERFDLDTNFMLGISDSAYIVMRNEVDKPYFPGKTFGFLLANRLNPRFTLETGMRIVLAGTKVDVAAISNFGVQQGFGIENFGETVLSTYNILEIPVIFRQRLGRSNKIDLSNRKTGSSLTNMYRHFFVSYGLGFGMPVNNREFYNEFELNDITGNLGIAALAGVGFHMNTRSPFFFNVRAHARATLLSYYEYAPIKTYYHSFGAEVKLGYRFPYKPKSQENKKPADCVTFTDSPDKSSRKRLLFGMRYGAQANLTSGSSTADPLIGFKGTVPATELQIETVSGEFSPTFTGHAGLHFEYLFHPKFAVGASPFYNERGFKSKHTYFLNDGRTLKTRQRVYIGYLDLPIKLIYYPTPRYFAHIAPVASIHLRNRLYDYYQVYDGMQQFPDDNINKREKIDVKTYYGSSPDLFSLGLEFGGGAHLDDKVSVSAQIGIYDPIFARGNNRPSLLNTTIQVSVYYHLIKQ